MGSSLDQSGDDYDFLELDLDIDGFDINAAFQSAIEGVASDEDIAMDEKVARMETIVDEGQSPAYSEFVDFMAMAAQIEMICKHDHELGGQLMGQEAVRDFIDSHSHSDNESSSDESKNGKKKVKKKSVTSRHLLAYFFRSA